MNLTQNVASLCAAKEISDSPTVSYQVGWHSTTLCKHGRPQHRTSHQRHEFRTVSRHVCAATVMKRNRKVTGNAITFRCCLTSISVRDRFKAFSSEMLREICWCLLAEVSEHLQGSCSPRMNSLILEDGTDTVSRNVGTSYQTTLRNTPLKDEGLMWTVVEFW